MSSSFCSARVVDEDLHAVDLRQRARVAHVRADVRIVRMLNARRLTVDADDLVSALQKQFRDRAPDALRRARDQRLHARSPFEIERYSRPTCSARQRA